MNHHGDGPYNITDTSVIILLYINCTHRRLLHSNEFMKGNSETYYCSHTCTRAVLSVDIALVFPSGTMKSTSGLLSDTKGSSTLKNPLLSSCITSPRFKQRIPGSTQAFDSACKCGWQGKVRRLESHVFLLYNHKNKSLYYYYPRQWVHNILNVIILLQLVFSYQVVKLNQICGYSIISLC